MDSHDREVFEKAQHCPKLVVLEMDRGYLVVPTAGNCDDAGQMALCIGNNVPGTD